MKAPNEAGIRKKSFELCYGGGTIWCEHLDGMGDAAQLVIEKLQNDAPRFSRPSVSSRFIVNVDETELSPALAQQIADTLLHSPKRIMKLALVGVPKGLRGAFDRIAVEKQCAVAFFADYEKAKEWCVP